MLLISKKYLVIFKKQNEQYLSSNKNTSVFRALSSNMACSYDILRNALMCEFKSHMTS
jgi:hypothetical protein